MSGETAAKERDRTPILFHETVYVAQYRYPGGRRFVQEYLSGWLEGGRNGSPTPLEKNAYGLQRRFDRDERFSVERAVVIAVLL